MIWEYMVNGLTLRIGIILDLRLMLEILLWGKQYVSVPVKVKYKLMKVLKSLIQLMMILIMTLMKELMLDVVKEIMINQVTLLIFQLHLHFQLLIVGL